LPLIGFENDEGQRLTFNQVWQLQSFAGLPIEVLYRIYLEHLGENRPGWMSVTTLLGCARKAYLKHTKPYYANPRFIYSAFKGTMTHAILEGTNALWAPGTIIAEKRYHRLVPSTDVQLSGKIDKYNVKAQCLEDYKTIDDDKVADLAKTLPEDYIWQTNIYRWILEGNGIPVQSIKIHFFSWKYAYTTGECSLISAKWFSPEWKVIPEVPILRIAQVEDFVRNKVKDVTRQELPPPISADKRFLCKGCAFNKDCWPGEYK
jgi:hypothetical protein